MANVSILASIQRSSGGWGDRCPHNTGALSCWVPSLLDLGDSGRGGLPVLVPPWSMHFLCAVNQGGRLRCFGSLVEEEEVMLVLGGFQSLWSSLDRVDQFQWWAGP